MITRSLLLLSTLTLLAVCAQKASAASVFQGKATTGEEVYLETGSIDSTNQSAVKFEYKIGKPGKKFDLVKASANCYNGVISPQNPGDFPAFQPNATGATRKMYNAVCRVSPGRQAGADTDRGLRGEAPIEPGYSSELTPEQETYLGFMDGVLAQQGNKYISEPRSRKLGAINTACRTLRSGSSVRGLYGALAVIDDDIQWRNYLATALLTGVRGGWCGEFGGELTEYLRNYR